MTRTTSTGASKSLGAAVDDEGGAEVPGGDLLIHCGDLTKRGSAPELLEVNRWLEDAPKAMTHCICIEPHGIYRSTTPYFVYVLHGYIYRIIAIHIV